MKQHSSEMPSTPPKKPYKAPKLLLYGDLNEMTLTAGTRGQIDNRTAPVSPNWVGKFLSTNPRIQALLLALYLPSLWSCR
jgi:hypothetical protein